MANKKAIPQKCTPKENVRFWIDIPQDTYVGLLQFAKDKGLLTPQEAGRLLLSTSLTKEGYPKDVSTVNNNHKF
jgi:hypothetical protein